MHGWLHNLGWADLWRAMHTCGDVLVVAYLIYRLMMLAKGTRAWQIITGLLVFLVILAFSSWAQLSALTWILKQMFVLGPLAIVILFYPELRHTLEEVGRLGFWGRGFTGLDRENLSLMVGEIVRVADRLSEKKIGALIVLEREIGLTDYAETGTLINADVNSELLETIFYPGTPLHDGAVIIRRSRVIAAGCTLPLTDNPQNVAAQQVHTRHKAALGITEQSDALVVVISEETGIVSLVLGGKMRRGRRGDVLRQDLMAAFKGQERAVVRRRRGLRPPRGPAPDSPAPAPLETTLPPSGPHAPGVEPPAASLHR